MNKNSSHGGFREGAGRKKTGVNSSVIRIPKPLITQVKELIQNYKIIEKEIVVPVGEEILVHWNSYDSAEKQSKLFKVIKSSKTYIEVEGGHQFIKVNKFTYGTLLTPNPIPNTYFWHIDWLEYCRNKGH